MKLVSMTDFVLEQKITNTLDTSQIDWYDKEISKLEKIRSYAKFLKTPLNLGMFVPCDSDGNVLEEPKRINYSYNPIINQIHDEKVSNYQKAKERVLFKNVSIKEHGRVVVLDSRGREITIANTKIGVMPMMIIEDLVIHGFELTNNYAEIFG